MKGKVGIIGSAFHTKGEMHEDTQMPLIIPEDYKGQYDVITEQTPITRKERREQSKKPKLSKALSYNMNKKYFIPNGLIIDLTTKNKL